MDGIAQIQARIAEIHNRFLIPSNTGSSGVSGTNGGDWTSAAGSTSFETALSQATSQAASASETSAVPAARSATASVNEQAVVTEARKYLGIPYLWGGTDPSRGLDCSGLAQLVYKNLGYDIPRVSRDQATAGRAVNGIENARPGDLVFYDNSSSRSGIDHVAIYIGDGKIIEAPRTGLDVRVNDVGNPVAIRRILPDDTSARPISGAQGTGTLSEVPYSNLFEAAGTKHGVPAALLAAVAKVESGFNPNAKSPAGAQGLMQFMPATAAGMGINPYDPTQAVDGAARYLAQQLRDFGTIDLALAAYNAGPGNVRKYGGIPPFTETQNYVRKVNDAWQGLKA